VSIWSFFYFYRHQPKRQTIMKRIIITAVTLGLMAFAPGDTCSVYAPTSPGMELEYKHFSAKDKEEGTTRMKVLAVRDAGSTIEVQNEMFDKKGKPVSTSKYELKCENGEFYVDMQTMVTSEQKAAFKDMELKIEGDKLDIPRNAVPGQKLRDGSLRMRGGSADSPFGINLTVNVTNRKVAGVENITVPAGTFSAVKITYDLESKLMVTTRGKAAEWYVKDIGLVRTESYDKNDKLQGYMVLQSKKQP
jgi:hypothetical protein